MIELSFADELKNANSYCATFARASMTDMFWRGVRARTTDPTATVTFIEFETRVYAVTARHVIEQFKTMAIQDGCDPEGYFLPAAPGVLINPPFISMPRPLIGHSPDIVMRPIDASLPASISKKAFRLEPSATPTFPVPYAMAAGYPTAEKSANSDAGMAMTGVIAVAEGVGSADGDQVQFFSEIENLPSIRSLSGMSGGPVYWSDGTAYGLLGFVKEAVNVEPKPGEPSLFAGPRVNFICERATYETFAEWARHADQDFPRQRELLNERVTKQANE